MIFDFVHDLAKDIIGIRVFLIPSSVNWFILVYLFVILADWWISQQQKILVLIWSFWLCVYFL